MLYFWKLLKYIKSPYHHHQWEEWNKWKWRTCFLHWPILSSDYGPKMWAVIALTMFNNNAGELHQLFSTFNRVWGAGGAASLSWATTTPSPSWTWTPGTWCCSTQCLENETAGDPAAPPIALTTTTSSSSTTSTACCSPPTTGHRCQGQNKQVQPFPAGWWCITNLLPLIIDIPLANALQQATETKDSHELHHVLLLLEGHPVRQRQLDRYRSRWTIHHAPLATRAPPPLHNVLFGQYDSPVSKNWNPKSLCHGKNYFWGYFSYVLLGWKL